MLQEKQKIFNNFEISFRNNVVLYIKNNPSSFVSLYWLSRESQYLLRDSVILLMPILSKKFINHSRFIELLKGDLTSNFKLKISKIPNLNLVDINGDTINSEFIKGKMILWDFWGTWCKPCLESIPSIKRKYDEIKDDKNWIIIGVVCDETDIPAKVNKIIIDNTVPWVNVFDTTTNGKITSMFGVYAFPTYILSNSQGDIIDLKIGDSNIDEVFIAIKQYLNK